MNHKTRDHRNLLQEGIRVVDVDHTIFHDLCISFKTYLKSQHFFLFQTKIYVCLSTVTKCDRPILRFSCIKASLHKPIIQHFTRKTSDCVILEVIMLGIFWYLHVSKILYVNYNMILQLSTSFIHKHPEGFSFLAFPCVGYWLASSTYKVEVGPHLCNLKNGW